MLVNLNSLLNKQAYIEDLCRENDLKVVGICESWLIPEIPNSNIEVEGYNILRNDSITNRRKHGVCMYVHKDITIGRVLSDHPNTLGVYLPGYDLFVLLVYRPPSNLPADDLALIEYMTAKCEEGNVCVMGDFNLPTVNWISDPPVATSHKDQAFLECFMQLGLTQHLMDPSFIPSGRTLDLVLSTDQVSLINALPPLPGCGHTPVMFSLNVTDGDHQRSGPPMDNHYLDWHKGDYPAVSRVLQEIDWEFEFEGRSLEDSYSVFSQKLNVLIDRYVPVRYKKSNKFKPWNKSVPNHLRTARATAWTDYKNSRSRHGRSSQHALGKWHCFNIHNQNLKDFKMSSRKTYELGLLHDLVSCPKRLHSYLKRQKTSRPPIGPLKVGNELTDNPHIMSEHLVDSFSEVVSSTAPSLSHAHQISRPPIGNINLTVSQVKHVLKELDPASCKGPDNVHPILLKSCRESLALPLCLLFTKSLSSMSVPNIWKSSIITPIYKKGLHSDPLNYRPISLTSVCSKTMERILTNAIRHHLDLNNILYDSQFGFRPGRSVLDQLIITYDYITRCYDLGNVVDLVLFDFRKAFDVVPHCVLLDKLFLLGFRNPLLHWIEDLLIGRTMRVAVSGTLSTPRPVGSGVPQGSVLGPLLFILFINYLTHDLHTHAQLFADDLKLYLGIPRDSSTYLHDSANLQSDIDIITSRAASWGLNFAVHKCVHLRFVRPFSSLPPVIPYTINSRPIPLQESTLDLGIRVDTSLRFHDHISSIAAKAFGVSNNIARGTVCRDPEFMKQIFITHIRPLLDFCSPVWNTGFIGDTKSLEAVQRRWTRKIDGFLEMSYGDRLRRLSLYSIWGRLLRADLIQVWKIVHELSPIPPTVLPRSNEGRTRGHPYKLMVFRAETEARRRFFTNRVVTYWNNLPAEVVTSTSVAMFKSRLHQALGDLLFYYHE